MCEVLYYFTLKLGVFFLFCNITIFVIIFISLRPGLDICPEGGLGGADGSEQSRPGHEAMIRIYVWFAARN